ncbi:Rz1-like lysis system protein LysC [Brenneria uluponensis]|uniref:Rz1-like lysis system protein LysC n=1 Tax=Brenneria uluponensis TaxID=3057057 RepID=UPI003CCC66F0
MPIPCQTLPANLTAPTEIPLPPGAGNRLTYGQSVQWNDLLLAALERANTDKKHIREAQEKIQELRHVKTESVKKND